MARTAKLFFSRRSVALRPLVRSSKPDEAVRQPPRTRPTSSADSLHPPRHTPSCFLHNPIPAFPFDSAGREARRTAGDRNTTRRMTATPHGGRPQHRTAGDRNIARQATATPHSGRPRHRTADDHNTARQATATPHGGRPQHRTAGDRNTARQATATPHSERPRHRTAGERNT